MSNVIVSTAQNAERKTILAFAIIVPPEITRPTGPLYSLNRIVVYVGRSRGAGRYSHLKAGTSIAAFTLAND
jgi:hypothetical protein